MSLALDGIGSLSRVRSDRRLHDAGRGSAYRREQNHETKRDKSDQPYAIALNHSPAYWAEESLVSVSATKEQTGGAYSLSHQRSQRNSGPAPYVHEQDEAISLLEGALTLIAGSQRFSAEAGSFLYIPGGTPHTFRIYSEEAQTFNRYLPGGFEAAITGLREPAKTRSSPPESSEAEFEPSGGERII